MSKTVAVTFNNYTIKETEINVLYPSNVQVEITSPIRPQVKIQYKIGTDGTWTDYNPEDKPVIEEDCIFYSRYYGDSTTGLSNRLVFEGTETETQIYLPKIKVTKGNETKTVVLTKEGTESQEDNFVKAADYYGEVIDYRGSIQDNKTYRLFYVDFDNKYKDGTATMYLKADWTENDVKLSDKIAGYTPDVEAKTKFVNMNSKWAETNSDKITRDGNDEITEVTINKNNEIASIWLSDPEQWGEYANGTDKKTGETENTYTPNGSTQNYIINYAVGSPSVEMYVDSFVESFPSVDLKYQVQSGSNGYGYSVNNGNVTASTSSNQINTDKNGLYSYNSTGDYNWWLASPSYADANNVCLVNTENLSLSNNVYGTQIGTSPIVSIQPTTLVKANYKNTSFANLADVVKVGDIVSYDATKGLTAGQLATEGLGKYTAPATATEAEISAQTGTGHSSTQTFNANGITSWKVLGINENGEVELLGITSDELTLSGQAGYNNGPDILEEIASIYGHGTGATGARAMKVEDIDQYTTYDKTTYSNGSYTYGTSKTYTFDNTGSNTGIHNGVVFEVESAEDENGNTTTQEITKGDTKTVQQTHYYYSISSNIKSGIPSSMFTDQNYWLASHCCILYSENCRLGLRNVDSGGIYGSSMFNTNGYVISYGRAVATVVTLQANIQTDGKDTTTGAWKIITDSSTPQTLNYYGTLANAMQNSKDATTIEVLSDTEETTTSTLPSNKTLTLDLKDKTVTLNNTTITNNGTLTITGQETGKLTSKATNTIYNENTGNVTIKSGKIENTNQNGTAIVVNGGSLTLGANDKIAGTNSLNVNTENPEIIGKLKGIKITSGVFNFYDGIIKGTSNAIDGDVTDIPKGYCIKNDTSTENEITYKTATLVQANYKNTSFANLADVVKVGDYVNYDANSNGTYTKAGEIKPGVTANQTFTTAEDVKWRVLSVDYATQKVTLMAEDPILKTGSTTEYNTVTLSGINGYKNVEEGLKEIGSIYGHGKGAESGRSIKLEDIMQYSNYDPTTYRNTKFTPNKTVGDTYTYTDASKKYIRGEEYKGEPVVKVPEGVTVTNNSNGTISASSVTVTQTYYYPGDATAVKASFTEKDAENGEEIYNMIFKKAGSETVNKNIYWLASRSVRLDTSLCCFSAHHVNSGKVDCNDLFRSTNYTAGPDNAFIPVVTLQANLQTDGKNQTTGAWNIITDSSTPQTLGYYGTLADAMQYSKDATTIEVLTNTEEATTSTLPSNKTLVLDLNGKTINLDAVSVTNNGTLAITGTGTLEGAEASVIVNNGTLTKNGDSTIRLADLTNSVFAIQNEPTGTFTLNKGTIESSSSTYNGSEELYAIDNKGILTMNNGSVIANSSGNTLQSAIRLQEDNFTSINGGTINASGKCIHVGTNCTQGKESLIIKAGDLYADGIAIQNRSSGNIKITGGNINSSSTNTIVNYATATGTIKITGGKITNTSTNNSNVPCVINYDGVIEISGKADISSEFARTVLQYTGSGSINISGGTITNKYTTPNDIATVQLSDTSTGSINISGNANIISTAGRAVVNSSTEAITISGGSITAKAGPAVHISTGTLTLGDESNLGNTTTPSVTGKTVGVKILNGTFNFYNGIIKGQSGEGTAIVGRNNVPLDESVINKPEGYGLQKTVATEEITVGGTTQQVEVETAVMVND